MVRDPERLAQFEREHAVWNGSYEQALKLFEALWQEARAVGNVATGDPMRGLEADIEIARTLNALRHPAHV